MSSTDHYGPSYWRLYAWDPKADKMVAQERLAEKDAAKATRSNRPTFANRCGRGHDLRPLLNAGRALVEFVATIVILTCTYALLAAGIVILYKAGRVVNFAHGELAIVGGYVFYSQRPNGRFALARHPRRHRLLYRHGHVHLHRDDAPRGR